MKRRPVIRGVAYGGRQRIVHESPGPVQLASTVAHCGALIAMRARWGPEASWEGPGVRLPAVTCSKCLTRIRRDVRAAEAEAYALLEPAEVAVDLNIYDVSSR